MKLGIAAELIGPLGSIPTIKKTTVYHVGNLDQPRTYSRTTGNEGNGLAVSEHPEEWKEIAKLGGYPTWKLTRSGLFVDVIKAQKNKKLMQALYDWGVKQGLVISGSVWTFSRYDDELDSEISSEFNTEEEARAELDSEDDDGTIKEQKGRMHATPKFIQWWKAFTKRNVMETIYVDDMLIYVFAEATGLYDGLWWRERLDPSIFSAPRGAIFQGKLGLWKKAVVAKD